LRASAAHHVGRDLVQFTAARPAHPAKQADRVFARGLTAGHEEPIASPTVRLVIRSIARSALRVIRRCQASSVPGVTSRWAQHGWQQPAQRSRDRPAEASHAQRRIRELEDDLTAGRESLRRAIRQANR
jgi:hypothetical protein